MCIPGSDNELLKQVTQRVLAGTALDSHARVALQEFLYRTQPWVPAVGDRVKWISGGAATILAIAGAHAWVKSDKYGHLSPPLNVLEKVNT